MGIKPIRGDGETTSNSDYAGRSWMNISTTTNFAANPNMTRYYYQSIYDLAGGFPVDMTHFYGKFRLLVHVTCPSGTEATIQAAFGHPYHTTLADKRLFVLEPVYIDSNYPYNFLDLGTIQIPLQKLNEQFIATALPTEAAYHDEYDNLRVSIWAQRVAGSGELTFDHLVFMPFEHSIEIGDIETEQPYDRIAIAELSTRELIAQQFYHKQGSLSVDARNWYIPKSGGILKVLIDSQSGNVSTAYTLELETRAIW
ncbi:MAG: hypothetical protein M9941_18010 [Anaerolineae bacterium]|nr:hypothetical protein [Anaerolineae bacterium]